MTDYRFPSPGVDLRFPSPSADWEHDAFPVDRRFPSPGTDTRYDGGYGGSLTPPQNTAVPVIDGTLRVGQTLSVTSGSWDVNDLTFAYSWTRDGIEIGGAITGTYTLSAADLGAMIGCIVTAIGANGISSEPAVAVGPVLAALPPPPENTSLPAFTGTMEVGQVLTGDIGGWSNASSFTYRWLRDGAAISGATATTYTLVSGDLNANIRFEVTATGAGGTTVSTSDPRGPVAQAPAGLVPVLDSTAVEPGFGRAAYDRQYVPAYSASNATQAIDAAIALGIIASSADAVDYATGNGGGAFASIDAWLTACGENKIGVIGSGNYSIPATRRYAPKGIFGYGVTRPVITAASNTSAVFFLNTQDVTVRYIRFEGFGKVFAAARDTTPGFVNGSADANPFHSGNSGYTWVMGGTGENAVLRTTKCGTIRISGLSGSSITAVNVRERNFGLERNARSWSSARSYVVNDQVKQSGGWYRCTVAHTSGTFSTDLAAGRWVLEFTFVGSDPPLAQVQELSANYTQKNLISSAVNWTTSDANTASLLATAINAGTGTHGYAATARGDAVIITRPTIRTFYKITISKTGIIDPAADNLMPDLDIADCWFQNCRNVYHGVSDSAGLGHVRFNRSECVGVEGVICGNTMQYGNSYVGNNTWRDVTQATTSNWFQTFFKMGTDYPHHLGFRNHIIQTKNNSASDITSTANSDGLNAAVFWDVRNALALVFGDVSATHNDLYRLRGTTGQEDCQPFYGKVVGGQVDRNRIRECGAGHVAPGLQNGAETSGIVFKDPGNTAGYENATFSASGNIFEDMPAGVCVLKLDNYNCNVRIDGNEFHRCNMSAASSDLVYTVAGPPPMGGRGLVRYTGLLRHLTIRGNIFVDCDVPKSGEGPSHIATHNTSPISGVSTLVISHNELRTVANPAYTANVDAIRLEDGVGSFASVQTGNNTIEGGFAMRFVIAGSSNQAGPGGAPAFTYTPPTVGGGGLLPAITGTLTQGQTLTCSTGTWLNSPTSYAYQWQRDDGGSWTNIGTNSSTFVLTASEVGKNVRCQVTASNANGASTPATATAVGPIAASGGAYDADAETWFARSSTQMTSTKKQAFSDFVAGLKADGIWAKLDMLYWLFGTGVEEQTLYDIKRSSITASRNEWNGTAYVTGVGPTWADATGWTGDGSNDLLRTGFNPGDGGGPYQIGGLSAAFGAYRISTGSSAAEFGVRRARIEGLTSGGARACRVFSGSSATQSGQSDGSGFYVGVRRAADQNTPSEIRLFRNGSQIAQANPSDYTPGTEVENMEWWICATNADTNGNRTYATSNIGMAFAGDELTDTEIANFNSRVQTLIAAL